VPSYRNTVPASRLAFYVGVLLLACVVALAGLAVWHLRAEAIATGKANARVHAHSLSAHASEVFASAQFLLDGLSLQVYESQAVDAASFRERFGTREMHDLLRARELSFEAVDAIVIVDPTGRVLTSSRAYPATPLDVSDREGFVMPSSRLADVTYVTAPVRNRITGAWTFYLARRLENGNGHLLGVAMLAFTVEHFSRFYDDVRVADVAAKQGSSAITLLRHDLAVLARAPFDEGLMGRRIEPRGAYASLARPSPFLRPPPPALTWDADPRATDHVVVAAQPVRGFPVSVAVSLRDDVYLAAWRQQATVLGLATAAVAVMLGLVFTVLVRVLQRREQEMAQNSALRQAAESASLAKSAFLSTMSHEIRTPMNGILGTTDLLLRSELGPRQRAWAEALQFSGTELMGIIDDILDVSKLEAGELVLELAPLDPRGLMAEVHASFAAAAAAKGLGLAQEIDDGVPPGVVGDAARIRQVLGKLVGNALKFSDTGGVQLRLAGRAGPEADAVVLRFEVEDSGVGIPALAREDLFHPFTQADASAVRRFGGAGLGLTIAKRLVLAMGGHIQFHSAPGRGSCFWFELTLATCAVPTGPARPQAGLPAASRPAAGVLEGRRGEATDDLGILGSRLAGVSGGGMGNGLGGGALEGALGPAPAIVSAPGGRGVLPAAGPAEPSGAATRASVLATQGADRDLRDPPHPARRPSAPAPVSADISAIASERSAKARWHVLVVEDNPVNSIVVESQLANLRCSCDVAGDGEEALQCLRERRYDLVLMDCMLPRLSGYDATIQWREEEAVRGLARLPIIALTANVLPSNVEQCHAAGMDDYVSKPCTVEKLSIALAPWLEGMVPVGSKLGAPR
jgi:signal transduction histidine kinase/ActR/RegA family two-component response regulator